MLLFLLSDDNIKWHPDHHALIFFDSFYLLVYRVKCPELLLLIENLHVVGEFA